jgi:hypothetical protein
MKKIFEIDISMRQTILDDNDKCVPGIGISSKISSDY